MEENKMPKYAEEIKAQCVERAKAGESLAAISKELGPNPKAIQRYCKAAGVDIVKKPRVKKQKAEE